MSPTVATKEPACPQTPVHTLNNAHGQKLYIVDPGVYTLQEVVWIQLRHNSRHPSDKLEIIRQTTYAPKDPRMAVLDGLLRRMCEWTLENPDFETPEFFNEDMRRPAEEFASRRRYRSRRQGGSK